MTSGEEAAGRVAVVTGAGSGIGFEIVRQSALRGMAVVLADIEKAAWTTQPAACAKSLRTPPSDVTLESPQLPNTTDWYGRFRLEQDASHHMDPIADRAAEHLGTSDALVISVRRRLLAAAHAFRENDIIPPGTNRCKRGLSPALRF